MGWFTKGWLGVELQSLEDMDEELERIMKKEVIALTKKYSKIMKGTQAEEFKEVLAEALADKRYQYEDKFTQTIRASLVISVLSTTEHQLILIANDYGKKIGSHLKVDDLSGGGNLEKIKKYFTKVLKVDGFSKNLGWPELMMVQRVRNILIHEGGWVKSTDTELTKYVNSSTEISFWLHPRKGGEKEHIEIGPTFVRYVIGVVRKAEEGLLVEVFKDKRFGEERP